jgi:hypothetical protein
MSGPSSAPSKGPPWGSFAKPGIACLSLFLVSVDGLMGTAFSLPSGEAGPSLQNGSGRNGKPKSPKQQGAGEGAGGGDRKQLEEEIFRLRSELEALQAVAAKRLAILQDIRGDRESKLEEENLQLRRELQSLQGVAAHSLSVLVDTQRGNVGR